MLDKEGRYEIGIDLAEIETVETMVAIPREEALKLL